MSVNIVLGELRQVARLFGPDVATPDGLGGFTTTAARLTPPEWRCSIENASVRSSERRFAATVSSNATHIMSGRYHPGITRQTTVAWTDRSGAEHEGNVLDVVDTDGAGVETVILVAEVVE